MKKLKWLSAIIIILNFNLIAIGQEKQQLNDLAFHLKKEGNYKSALKEYLRLYYFDEENNFIHASKEIAECFVALEDSKNALKYYDLYFFKLKYNDPERNEVRFAKQKLLLIDGEANKALAEVLQVNKSSLQDFDKYYFMLSFNYLIANQNVKAKAGLKNLSYFNKIDTLKLNNKLKDLNKNFKKNPKNAKWYSMALPGLGQAINGDVVDGLKSFTLYVGFIALFIDLQSDLGLADSALTIGPWISRYYIGGLGNAVKSAKRKKYNKQQKLLLDIVNIVQLAKDK
ncbi:MAG: hypothetical protein RLZZ546_2240 [Bacteroidota bacterium]|jgi:hypothetical protein